jgi:hypothetical protein
MEEKNRNSNGSFAKGHKGFKPKGATNLANREVKEKFHQLLDSYPVEQMIEDLQELKPRERLSMITGLLEYFMPKLNKTDWGISNNNEPIIIQLPKNNADRYLESKTV